MVYSKFFKSKIYLKYNTLTQLPHIYPRLGKVIKKSHVERGAITLLESILNISVVAETHLVTLYNVKEEKDSKKSLKERGFITIYVKIICRYCLHVILNSVGKEEI